MNGYIENWDEEWKKFRAEQDFRYRENQAMIQQIQTRISDVREIDIPSLRVEVAMLKVKAGVWGAAAGLIPVVGFLLTKLLTH